MITITSPVPPAITKLLSGTYVVPTWTKVPDGTVLSDILWVRPQPTGIDRQTTKTYRVKSYTITVYGTSGRVTCTCPGYTYRKKCKHILDYQ
jgi:hypothetical protein